MERVDRQAGRRAHVVVRHVAHVLAEGPYVPAGIARATSALSMHAARRSTAAPGVLHVVDLRHVAPPAGVLRHVPAAKTRMVRRPQRFVNCV
ncbi:hypothetical protein [Burkholderia vietnamiensis]|uniref:hypothetical protein n=1 Tax=Burkholderia vietnamiensis TaxID=60552 RepID=UPI0012D9967A|nr:hypothetical protein [Burkholderia vietnamiensis]